MLPGLFLAARVLTFQSNPAHDSPALLPLAIPAGPTLSSPLLRAESCLRGNGTACARGPIAKANSAGDFNVPPRPVPDGTTDAAAEGSAFFHAARARTFFESLAGHAIANDVTVVVGLDEPTSFYENRTVWLGRGTARDFAYDGDLVSHEMTHAMLDGSLHAHGFRRTAYGASIEPEALSEAIADYYAAVLTNDPNLGEWASGEPGASNAYRSLSDVVSCPAGINGFPHDEATMFSGALWSVRASLPENARSDFDREIYAAIARSPARADAGYSDIAVGLSPSSSAALAVELERRDHGCAPIFELPLRAKRGAFFAPGTAAFPGASIAPGILQLRVDLAVGTTRLAVDFQLVRIGDAPFEPSVAVSWDTALEWRGAESNAAMTVPAAGDTLAHADLEVPAGARVAYLQILNRGATDGAYDYVTATESGSPTTEPPTFIARGSGCTTAGGEARFDFALAVALVVVFRFTARRSRGGTGCHNRRARSCMPTSCRGRR